MTYSADLEVPATYDTDKQQNHVGESKEAVVDLSGMSADRLANAPTTATASTALEVTASSRIALSNAPSVKSTLSATQTIQNGYQLFEGINESDWWWWYVALDINDGLIATGETLYQFVTLTDSANTSFTLGCYIKKGTSGDNIHYFTHTAGQPDELTSTSSVVTGKTWATQAADLREEPDDIKWSAGTTRVPTANLAPTSTTAGNTNHACYFYEELPKIGRNPKDFDKTFTVKFGARIYKTDAATTFDSVPESSNTITKAALPSYVAAATTTTTSAVPTGAVYEFTMVLASLFLLFSVLN